MTEVSSANASLREAPTWPQVSIQSLPKRRANKKTQTSILARLFLKLSIICHIPDSWINLLNGYNYYFWLRESLPLKRVAGGFAPNRFICVTSSYIPVTRNSFECKTRDENKAVAREILPSTQTTPLLYLFFKSVYFTNYLRFRTSFFIRTRKNP